MKLKIRNERPDDYPAIKIVNDFAFEREEESILVENLRKTKIFDPELSLVAILSGEIVGHILFYPVMIKNGEKTYETICLAPMSVLPEFQNLGIGMELVQKGLATVKKKGYTHVHVLGHPEYYPRFGFVQAEKFNIRAEFKVASEAFMMLELVKGSLKNIEGVIRYPEEFEEAL